MEISQELKDFLEKNKALINKNEFDKIYDLALAEIIDPIDLTIIFYKSKINVLKYITNIPFGFLSSKPFSLQNSLIKNRDNYLFEISPVILKELPNFKFDIIRPKAFHSITSQYNLSLNNINRIKKSSFSEASADNIILNNCKIIDNGSFSNININNLIINGSWSIETAAFKEANVNNIILDSTEIISMGSFYNCSNVKEIHLGKDIKKIEDYAFVGCPEDLIIYCKDVFRPIDWEDKWNCSSTGKSNRYEVVWGHKHEL